MREQNRKARERKKSEAKETAQQLTETTNILLEKENQECKKTEDTPLIMSHEHLKKSVMRLLARHEMCNEELDDMDSFFKEIVKIQLSPISFAEKDAKIGSLIDASFPGRLIFWFKNYVEELKKTGQTPQIKESESKEIKKL